MANSTIRFLENAAQFIVHSLVPSTEKGAVYKHLRPAQRQQPHPYPLPMAINQKPTGMLSYSQSTRTWEDLMVNTQMDDLMYRWLSYPSFRSLLSTHPQLGRQSRTVKLFSQRWRISLRYIQWIWPTRRRCRQKAISLPVLNFFFRKTKYNGWTTALSTFPHMVSPTMRVTTRKIKAVVAFGFAPKDWPWFPSLIRFLVG